MEQSEFLKVGLEAVEKAKEVVMKYYQQDPSIEWKEDKTPVTIADKEAEAVIIETIKTAFPDHGFLGEETGETEGSKYVWVIDPIDGTSNYIKQIPLWGTLICLMKDGEPILGISCIPVLNETLYAEKGKGVFLNGKQVKVSDCNSLSDSMIVHGGQQHFMKNGTFENLAELFKNVKRIRGIGDLYMHHLLASGRVEVSIEGYISIWDIAPFVVIIGEAGGKVSDLAGNPITKNSTTFIATNGVLHDQVLEYFR
jgi:histidinol-phosphatase